MLEKTKVGGKWYKDFKKKHYKKDDKFDNSKLVNPPKSLK